MERGPIVKGATRVITEKEFERIASVGTDIEKKKLYSILKRLMDEADRAIKTAMEFKVPDCGCAARRAALRAKAEEFLNRLKPK